MTLQLTINTVGAWGSVGIAREGQVVADCHLAPRTQGRNLAPAIAFCCEAAGTSLGQLDHVLVADGPGSFTGLRIGWASVKGVAAAVDTTVYAVSTLLLQARAVWRPGVECILAASDALRGEAFIAIYRFEPGFVTVHTAPKRFLVEHLPELLPDQPVLSTGKILEGASSTVREWLRWQPGAVRPTAEAMVAAWTHTGAYRLVEDLDQFRPEYGRDAEARVRLEQRSDESP